MQDRIRNVVAGYEMTDKETEKLEEDIEALLSKVIVNMKTKGELHHLKNDYN